MRGFAVQFDPKFLRSTERICRDLSEEEFGVVVSGLKSMSSETAFIIPAVPLSNPFSTGSLRPETTRCHAVPARIVSYPKSPVARSLQSYRSGERLGSSKRRPRASPDEYQGSENEQGSDSPQVLSLEENTNVRQNDVREDEGSKEKALESRDVENLETDQDGSKSRKGTQIPLSKALVRLKVASEDTCTFLIRNKYVSVNEVVVDDVQTRVDCTNDKISVKGQEIGTVSNATPPVMDENDRKNIPKPQRYRSPKKVEDIMQNHRSIDGGFYARRRRMYGK